MYTQAVLCYVTDIVMTWYL